MERLNSSKSPKPTSQTQKFSMM